MNKNIVKGPTRIKRQFFRLRVRPSKAPAKSTSITLLVLGPTQAIRSKAMSRPKLKFISGAATALVADSCPSAHPLNCNILGPWEHGT